MKPFPFLLKADRPAIIVPVQSASAEELERHCARIGAIGVVDAIEWRIDPLIAAVAQTRSDQSRTSTGLAEAVADSADRVTLAGLPVLLTFRSGFEGGHAQMTEAQYGEILNALLDRLHVGDRELTVSLAVDVEISRKSATDLIHRAHELEMPVVASHHNFAATDSFAALSATFDAMAAVGADVAKIAMMPRNPADVTALLRATAEADVRLDIPVIGISMGEFGRTSRIMGGDFGSCASFAQVGEASAPGQVAADSLARIFDELYS